MSQRTFTSSIYVKMGKFYLSNITLRLNVHHITNSPIYLTHR